MNNFNENQRWFKDARFGLFIHFGVYSALEGRWKGTPLKNYGEWAILETPKDEYYECAKSFNPENFNANEWVKTAKNAGMNYLVITAKHVDGYCLFKSEVDDYNIATGSVFKRDMIAELSEACKRHGLRFGIYYSQCIDYAYDGASHLGQTTDLQKFDIYIHKKVLTQITELLTNYGPIATFWFDNPFDISVEQAKEVYELIKKLQPDCLVNARLGQGFHDYLSAGDNQSVSFADEVYWEMPATMNDTWGFKKDDTNWKTKEELLYLLIDCSARNGNYLLNVGPDGMGCIPQASKERLKYISGWIKKNREAVYGNRKTPFNTDMKNLRTTLKDNKLYIIPLCKDSTFTLYGLKNNVVSFKLLEDPDITIEWKQEIDTENNLYKLSFDNTKAPAGSVYPVYVAEFEGETSIDKTALHETDGSITLPCSLSQLHKGENSRMNLGRDGVIYGWDSSEDYLTWEVTVNEPGEYMVKMVVSSPNHIDVSTEPPLSGFEMRFSICDQVVQNIYTNKEKLYDVRSKYFPEYAKTLGTINIGTAGKYQVKLSYTGKKEEVHEEYKGEVIQSMYVSDVGKKGITVKRIELLPV